MKYSKYILTISVALNLLLIGYLIGTQSMNIFSTKEKQGSQNRMINIITEADLSNDLKEEFINRLSDLQFSKRQNSKNEMKTWNDEMRDTLTADQFNAESYRTLLETRSMFFATNQQKAIDTMVDLLSVLSKEDRIKMSKILLKNLKKKK